MRQPAVQSFRERIRSGDVLVGAFVKTPAFHAIELLGLGGLDFVVADREHAPISNADLDSQVLAAARSRVGLIVRVPALSAPDIAAALDLGCGGVVVPHIRNEHDAQSVLDAALFERGKRGFSPSARAGGYGTTPPRDYRERSDGDAVIMVQIEDGEALDRLDQIAAEDVDVLFIGPADLALSLGVDAGDPKLLDSITKIAAAGARHGRAVAIFIVSPAQISTYRELGISLFVCGSDQGMLVDGARRLVEAARPS